MRGYGDVVPLGASLTPLRGTDSIMWTVKFRDGQMKRFKFAIRTTPVGFDPAAPGPARAHRGGHEEARPVRAGQVPGRGHAPRRREAADPEDRTWTSRKPKSWSAIS